MQRGIINRPAAIRILLEDGSGVLVDADPSTDVTVEVRDDLGVLVASGNASRLDTGCYQFAVTHGFYGVLTAEWTATIAGATHEGKEHIRLVNRRAVPLSTLRKDQTLAGLSTWDFLTAVDGAEDSLENALRFRIVTTADRARVQIARAQRVLRLPGPLYIQTVVSAERDGTELDVETIDVRDDALELPTSASWDFLTGAQTGTWLPGRYDLLIQHGLVETPADIQRAVTILARHNAATEGPYPDRASRIVSAETEIWFARSGPDSWFGIPEVDAVIAKRQQRLPISDNPSF